MKRYLTTILLLAALLTSFSARAQEEKTVSSDTLYVNFLESLDKGDILPFKYIYQRAKIGIGAVKDTTITSSITKDISFEVLENNKEDHWIHLSVTQENFKKEGPECNIPYFMSNTCLIGDGTPYEIIVEYNGDLFTNRFLDELLSRYTKNLDYICDTLSKSSYVDEKLSKEQWEERFSYMRDSSFIMWHAASDYPDLFFFGGYGYQADTAYVSIDSLQCDADHKWYYSNNTFGWDKSFSDSNEDFKDLYVFRSFERFDPHLVLDNLYSSRNLSKEEMDELLEKADPRRLFRIINITELADKAAGLPILLDKEITAGYYEKVGDDYISVTKELLALDLEKLVGGDDEDEDEDEDSPRYDDYCFIKVK